MKQYREPYPEPRCKDCKGPCENERPRRARQFGVCAKCYGKRLDKFVEKVGKA
jgi:hypothetical protein